MRISIFLLLCLALLPLSVSARTINDVRTAEHGEHTRTVIEFDHVPSYVITNFSQSKGTVQVDIHGVDRVPQYAKLTGKEKLISAVQIKKHPSTTGKYAILIHTQGPVAVNEFTLEDPFRLVLDLSKKDGLILTDQNAAQAVIRQTVPRSTPPTRPQQSVAKTQPEKAWKHTIVVDPGHGGYHKGGVGNLGGRTVYEKDVTIQVAQRLERYLRADPRFEVKLTRRTDTYVGLYERTQIASRLKGDMFISLHCNAVESNRNRARGFEIWAWNRNNNSSAAAKALAKIENDDPGVSSRNSSILSHMMEDALESQSLISKRLADVVHGAFMQDDYFRKYDRGIKSARFKVLENYAMPSILIEMGFITHPSEVKYLFQADFQEKQAKYIYEGIVRYYQQTDPDFPSSPNPRLITARVN